MLNVSNISAAVLEEFRQQQEALFKEVEAVNAEEKKVRAKFDERREEIIQRYRHIAISDSIREEEVVAVDQAAGTFTASSGNVFYIDGVWWRTSDEPSRDVKIGDKVYVGLNLHQQPVANDALRDEGEDNWSQALFPEPTRVGESLHELMARILAHQERVKAHLTYMAEQQLAPEGKGRRHDEAQLDKARESFIRERDYAADVIGKIVGKVAPYDNTTDEYLQSVRRYLGAMDEALKSIDGLDDLVWFDEGHCTTRAAFKVAMEACPLLVSSEAAF
jgi:hypothetical protein